jgi:hypothetical protein
VRLSYRQYTLPTTTFIIPLPESHDECLILLDDDEYLLSRRVIFLDPSRSDIRITP